MNAPSERCHAHVRGIVLTLKAGAETSDVIRQVFNAKT